MTTEKINWKPALVVWGLLTAVLLFATLYVSLNNHYVVTHQAEIVRPGYESYPESYKIQISPAQAFGETWNFGRVLGYILWIAMGAFMVAINNDMIGKKERSFGSWVAKRPQLITAAFLLISVFLIISTYSVLFAGRFIEVPPQVYDQIKDSPEALANLFRI